MKTTVLIALTITLCSVLAACARPGGESTPTAMAPPPAAPTSTPHPTAAPTEAFTIISSTDQIIGIWASLTREGYIHEFLADGTIRSAQSVPGLATPYAVNQYWFEDNTMYVTLVSVSGVRACAPGIIAKYEVKLMESGKMKMRAIDEKCIDRRNDLQATFDPVR